MRTVRLEHQASQSLDHCKAKFGRFDEVYQGLEWLLARNPLQGFDLGGNLRVCFQTAQWAQTPGILAVFSHTANEVVIYDLKAI
ncbi:MAG: hypothetical protein OYG32_05860 [Rhodospirillaceae bacterium]|nr:hypothetical protein [Rhodospirillaceae bacterium]